MRRTPFKLQRILTLILTAVLCLGLLPMGTVAQAADAVAVNETNFPDAVFRQLVSDRYDDDNDGMLSGEEIAGATFMPFGNMGISDFQGIEFLTELTHLYCGENNLENLDVSKNTKLEHIAASCNKLKELDVSNLTALNYLACDGNELTKLDVSGCTALQALYCHENELSVLDVSDCTELGTLVCGDNNLTSLDVSSCTKLGHLLCENNDLTQLDMSNCTEFVCLECWNNSLTALDVSGFTALEKLYCNNNRLTQLDVGDCIALTDLDCNNNNLTSIDLSNNTQLDDLNYENNEYTIILNSGNEYDLSTLPGNFDATKASGFSSGSVNGTTLIVPDDVDTITYKYDFQNTPNTIGDHFTLHILRKYTVSLAASPEEGGTVSLNSGESSASVSGSYDKGTNVPISATPNPGYRFVCWILNEDGPNITVAATDPKTSVKRIAKDTSYKAIFEQTGTTEGIDDIFLNTSLIAGPDGSDSGRLTSQYHYVYFGNYNGAPVIWRVLDEANGNAVGVNDSLNNGTADVANSGAMLLLSDYTLYDDHFKQNKPFDHTYEISEIRTELENVRANVSNFSAIEQSAMLATTISDNRLQTLNGEHYYAAINNVLNGDKFFLLSAEEALSSSYFPKNAIPSPLDLLAIDFSDPDMDYRGWWLRSRQELSPIYSGYTEEQLLASNAKKSAVYILPGGYPRFYSTIHYGGVRPAFNLEKSKVLFTSAAVEGKVGNGHLAEVQKNYSNEWKLTLLDNGEGSGRENFAVTPNTVTVTTAGGNVSIDYSGAKTGENEYLSAIIVDSENNVLYYGRLKNLANVGDESGTQTIDISALLQGNYTLKLFNEQYNGDKKTDYASAFADVTLTVSLPVAATWPVTVINGAGGGEYAENATVTITADTPPVGMQFLSWTVESGGITLQNAASPETIFTMPANAVTVKANWTSIGGGEETEYCTLAFETNGGSEIAPVTKEKGTVVTLSDFTPNRNGYTFEGWYSDAALTNVISAATLSSDMTVYAKWSYKGNSDTGPSTDPGTGYNPLDDVPQTGDNSNLVLWIALMLISGMGIVGTIVYWTKRKRIKHF